MEHHSIVCSIGFYCVRQLLIIILCAAYGLLYLLLDYTKLRTKTEPKLCDLKVLSIIIITNNYLCLFQ
jgi:hypothetical protein